MLISKRSMAITLCAAIVFGVSASAMAIESTLAGVRLGAPGSDVLRRYGNPSRITVGYVYLNNGDANQGQPGGVPGVPGMGAVNPMAPPTGAPSAGNALGPLGAIGAYYNNLANEAGGGAPVLPGIGGLGMPGMPTMPGQMPGMPNQPQVPTEQQITWSYDKGANTMEFIVSDKGVVVQITASGTSAFALAKTTKGVKFGTAYKDVVMKYGFPESHVKVGKFVRASYADSDRVVFTFLNEKVVGITVALKLDE